jgi:tyrosyl-tRNA synthetase
LASELTRLVHGPEGLAAAQRATEVFFGAEIRELDDAQLVEIFAEVPSKQLPLARLAGDGLSILDALCESGLTKSKGESRRVVGEGGAYVNNRRVETIDLGLREDSLASETVVVLRRGKKNYALLRFTD